MLFSNSSVLEAALTTDGLSFSSSSSVCTSNVGVIMLTEGSLTVLRGCGKGEMELVGVGSGFSASSIDRCDLLGNTCNPTVP